MRFNRKSSLIFFKPKSFYLDHFSSSMCRIFKYKNMLFLVGIKNKIGIKNIYSKYDVVTIVIEIVTVKKQNTKKKQYICIRTHICIT